MSMTETTKPMWTVTVNGRLWERCGSQRAAIRLWKTLAYNALFKATHVAAFDPFGYLIKEKLPQRNLEGKDQ